MAYPTLAEGQFLIPACNMDSLQAKLAKLQRRAIKLGVPAPGFIKEGEFDEPVLDEKGKPTGEVKKYAIMRATGEAPKFAGWTFAAAVDILPEVGNLVRLMPGQTLPVAYRTEAGHCDHCKIARNRHNHYVVRNDAGEYKMVGSGCIRDFLGHNSPENLLAYAQMLASLDDSLREEKEYGGSGEPDYLDLAHFLSYVAAAIGQYGWISRSKAMAEQSSSTSSQALNGMFHKIKECRDGCLHPTEADKELAAKSIIWAQSLKERGNLNDFEHNVSVLSQSGVIPSRGTGIAAAIVFCYKREVEKEILHKINAAKLSASQHVGEIGKRQEFSVTVLNEYTKEGEWGLTRIYRLIDVAGNVLTWFSSGTQLEVGQAYVLQGSVKKHDIYNNVKQTVITRCKLVEPKVQEAK